jgi:SAM-dependent methyltransferase
MHWADAYYGDLYLGSVEDLLTPSLSSVEAAAISALLRLGPGDRVLDLACGHGRHALALAPRVAQVIGLDRSGAYLRRAACAAAVRPGRRPSALRGPCPEWVRGDVRALPFRGGAFGAAFSWYASLFMFDDDTNAACLADAGRVVRPGGRLLVHHANPLRLAREPVAEARRVLADGSVVEERSEFDAPTGVDRCARRLVRPAGAILAATAELRYYMPSEWKGLAYRAGLRLIELTTTPDAVVGPRRDPGPEAPDLIAVLETPT